MSQHKRFPFEKVDKLDRPERRWQQPAEPLVDLIAASSPDCVLEVGVGTGYFALPLARRLAASRVIGLDLEARMLDILVERAQEQGVADRLEPLLGPEHSAAIPLEDGAVDAVLLANLYHELGDRQATLAEVGRVLAGGGLLVVCDWDPDGADASGPPREHRVPRAMAETELAAAGFGDLTAHHLYDDFYVLSARRAGA